MMKILSLDLSTKPGWALFVDGIYNKSGALPHVEIEDFNIKNYPTKSPLYPRNIMRAADTVCLHVSDLVIATKPDVIVIEDTVRGKCRSTQRVLEWIHYAVLRAVNDYKLVYLSPSEWRKIMDLKLSNADKINNKEVKQGKRRGAITRKHLSVRMANTMYGLELLQKDNDQADAILLGAAYCAQIKKAGESPA